MKEHDINTGALRVICHRNTQTPLERVDSEKAYYLFDMHLFRAFVCLVYHCRGCRVFHKNSLARLVVETNPATYSRFRSVLIMYCQIMAQRERARERPLCRSPFARVGKLVNGFSRLFDTTAHYCFYCVHRVCVCVCVTVFPRLVALY